MRRVARVSGGAASHGSHGIVQKDYTVSAGNEGAAGPIYPAAFPEALAVAAVGPTGELADFSSFGDGVDVAAPGIAVVVPAGRDGYRQWDGTAFACTIASGVVALMLRANARLPPEQIKRVLCDTATPMPPPFSARGGLVNAFRAVVAAAEYPATPPPRRGMAPEKPAREAVSSRRAR